MKNGYWMRGRLLLAVVAILTTVYMRAQESQSATEVTDVITTGESTVAVHFSDGQQRVLDWYGPAIVRVFQDPQGGEIRDPEAHPEAHILVADARQATGTLTITKQSDGKTWAVGTQQMTVAIESDGSMDVLTTTADGKSTHQIVDDLMVNFVNRDVTVTVTAQDGECFYGGGMQNGRFSHAGKIIQILNTNNWTDGGVSSPTPFYWSSKGYGLMFYTFHPGRYDFGATEPGRVVLTHETDYLDLFIMAPQPISHPTLGEVRDGILPAFYQLTGYPVLLPKFGFYVGHLNAYNRDHWTPVEEGGVLFEDGQRYKESQKNDGGIRESLNGEVADSLGRNSYPFSARAVIDRYAAHDMPLGWILPNDGYATGYGQTGTLDGNIDNLRQFGEYAHGKGVEIGLWTQSDLYPKEGVEPLLQRDIVREVRDGGVRALKTDVAWVGAGYSFGLDGVADVASVMTRETGGARPFIVTVDGWAGTQRYAGIWSGDQTGGQWEYIRFHIPTYIGASLSGQPNVGSDLDGIFGGKNLPVNVRDYQWKAFSPIEMNMDGWGANEKYPHALGERAEAINRTYLKLKASLMPYTYSIAYEAAVGGQPMLRPLSYGVADGAQRQKIDNLTKYEYLYGPAFVVAPIYQDTRMDEEGNDIRNGIYLPEGRWLDPYTNRFIEGGCIVNSYPAPLDRLPYFVREGSIIPYTAPHNQPRDVDASQRAYEIVPGACQFVQYDDDGTTDAYLRGKGVKTVIESDMPSPHVFVVWIAKSTGMYDGFETFKQTTLRIHCDGNPRGVAVKNLTSGKQLKKTKWNYSHGMLVVEIPKLDVTRNTLQVVVDGLKPLPNQTLAEKTGTLPTPQVEYTATAYTVTPTWTLPDNADYAEILFDGLRYTTLREGELVFDGLKPETVYSFQLRYVNAEHETEWVSFNVTTEANPLEWAIQGIKATTTCENQEGQDISRLFDFDESTVWHTKWGEKAVPFTINIDLGCTIQPDRIEYLPREDAANGTLLEGTLAVSLDGQQWSEAQSFSWVADATVKTIDLRPLATESGIRYLRMEVMRGRGDFGSGRQLYVFRQPGSEVLLPGDINRDGRVDMDDFTSYMNYTGLRTGDPEFDGYVSSGDINHNGRIDAYDISVVATQVLGGAEQHVDHFAGALDMAFAPAPDTKDAITLKAGQTLTLSVNGKDLSEVNAFGFALPYDATLLEYVATEPAGTLDMENLTNDRLHAAGDKVLYPIFVNTGDRETLSTDGTLCRITFRARRNGKVTLQPKDIVLVDKMLNTIVQ